MSILMGTIFLVLLLSNTTALTLTSGNSIIKDYSEEFYSLNGSYFIIGNSSNLEGLNITFDGTKVNITLALGYAPDNFNITFYGDVRQEQVTSTIITGSGSSGCLINWSCSEWSICQNEKSIRTCTKAKPLYCYGGKKPIEIKNCSVQNIPEVIKNETIILANDSSSITPPGIPFFWKVIAAMSVITLIIVGYIYLRKPKVQEELQPV